MRRLRVAHIITRLCQGGAQENTFHSVRLADPSRFEVDLISGPTEGDEGSIEDEVAQCGIPILRAPDLAREVSPLRDFRALRQLDRLLEEGRYDIVHTHTSKAGILGRLAAVRQGVPIVVHTPHGNIFDGYFSGPVSWVFSAVERRAARWADRLVELTDGGIEAYLDRGIGRREQYVTIFSGIDLAPYEISREAREKTREALGVSADSLLVGGVGRLEPVKGFEYFIGAAQVIAEAVPEALFVLVGSGSLEPALRELAGPLGDRFRFTGFRKDIPHLMAAMDLLVVPSLNEGMGRVVLEAGAAGACVVASDVGGIPDVVVDGKTGVLVPPEDAAAIAGVVEALARDPERRRKLAGAAMQRIVPEYGLERMVGKIEALYMELAGEKKLDAGR